MASKSRVVYVGVTGFLMARVREEMQSTFVVEGWHGVGMGLWSDEQTAGSSPGFQLGSE